MGVPDRAIRPAPKSREEFLQQAHFSPVRGEWQIGTSSVPRPLVPSSDPFL
jgi:hypothetical protein